MTEPAGAISLALEYLRKTLGKSATLRTWVGAADQAAAVARIHKDALPLSAGGGDKYTLEELQTLRPYVIISETPEDGFRARAIATSDSYDFVGGGEFRIELAWDVPPDIAADPAEVAIQWRNTYGQILDDLTELAGTAGYLDIRELVVVEGPWRTKREHRKTFGDAVGIELGVLWGVQS